MPIQDETVRQNIVQNLIDRFEAYQVDAVTYWHHVTNDDIEDHAVSQRDTRAVAIIDVGEQKGLEVQHYRSNLRVDIEFEARAYVGEPIRKQCRDILKHVQFLIAQDVYCGGNSLNVIEIGNEFDVETSDDVIIRGIVQYAVTYRHYVSDPTRIN